MKQPTILAIFILSVLPFALVAQQPSVKSNPTINETPKEQRVNTFMKTNPMQPSIVLQYTDGDAPMNTTSKEELKMPVKKGNAATATAAKRRDKKNNAGAMNLSAKEKMKMGL